MNEPNPSPEASTSQSTEPVLNQQVEAISELFSRSLDTWTEADMERMIAELRKRRMEFDKNPEAAKKRQAKPKIDVSGKSTEDLLSALNLNL